MASIDENVDKFEQIEKSIEQLEGRDFIFLIICCFYQFSRNK